VNQQAKAKFCVRFNGGPNAGHTVYVRANDPYLFINPEKTTTQKIIKFATHQVPTGVLFGITSIIGYNCVVDLEKLYYEIQEIALQLGKTYQQVASLITITPEAHVILPWHIEKDRKNNKVGTTGTGIGPCYADKAYRRGYRIIDYYQNPNQYIYNHADKEKKLQELTKKLTELSTSFTNNMICGVQIKSCKNISKELVDNDVVVMEGAQGYHLDINHGQYPFVTSSDCTIAAVCSYGFDLSHIHSIGVSKAYQTYVGANIKEANFNDKQLYSGDAELLRLLGKEYGVTTGRRRQCLPLNMDLDFEALRINQTRQWIISISDILDVYQTTLSTLQTYCETQQLPEPNTDYNKVLIEYITNVGKDNYPHFQHIINNGAYQLIYQNQMHKFQSWSQMKEFITTLISTEQLPHLQKVIWWNHQASEVTIA
jgi:adenylosuccinate synthase